MSEPGCFSGHRGPFRIQAIRQHGVFTLSQLLHFGLSASGVRKRVARGALHRIHRGVYALVPPELLTREGRFLAAVYACGEGAVASHRTAAALHELRATAATRFDVTIPCRSPRKRPGINIYRSTTLSPADVTEVLRIPCTTVARTQLDLGEVVARRAVERAFDQAEVLETFDLGALHDQLARNATRRGAKVVREVLAQHYVGSTMTWSELEERFLTLLLQSGLPRPEVNAWLLLEDGGDPIRPDFLWREQRVLLEVDGRRTHGTRQAFERDRRRDQRATACRWIPLRATWHQLERTPDDVIETILAVMARC